MESFDDHRGGITAKILQCLQNSISPVRI